MEQLKKLRAAKGLSQAKLAARAGLDPSTVNQIERGMRNASPGTLRKLADALEVSLYELIEEEVPKAGAPPSPEPEGFSEEERRYLTLLMDSYEGYFSDRSKRNGPRIANLPQDLSPEGSLRVYQWVAEFMADCDLLEERLDQAGVMEAVITLVDRANDGAYVPPQLLQKAQGFQRAWEELFVGVWTAATDWVESQRRRPEVMEFSNKERLTKKTGSASVTDFHEFKQQKKRMSFPGAVAKTAG